ncbi:sodium-dependent transporter [Arhodomonas sp. AD133]|uniref:sodium-dependent transporter n=1 Tax=Arhodomonas sp. AD133 TaxID=3415009 RepID=UPI003EB6B7D1
MLFAGRSAPTTVPSARGFTLLLVGATVGLGNIWRFPWLVGEYGGSAFVGLYVLCLLGLGLPLLIAELLIGRCAGVDPVRGLARVAVREGHSPAWGMLGALATVVGVVLVSLYGIVGGWALAYVFRAASGAFDGLDSLGAGRLFQALVADGEALLGWYTLFLGAAILVTGRDLRHGIEVAARWFVPMLGVLLAVLVITQWRVPGFTAAVAFLFVPQASAVSSEAVLAALGHAFFTLSLGTGVMLAFGSYRRGGVVAPALWTVTTDTVFAVLAGLAVFPAVFTGGMTPASGAGLAFQSLPVAFGAVQGGHYLGVLFFAALTLAAWTSVYALMEPAVAWLAAHPRIDRAGAASTVGVVAWLLGLLPLLSFGLLEHWRVPLLGETVGLFDAVNRLLGMVLLPAVGLGVAFFAGWVLSAETVRLALLPPALGRVWRFLVRFAAPVALVLIGLEVAGVLA